VAGLGGKCLGVKEFTDRYWDDSRWRLCSQDLWLRQRDGAWELWLGWLNVLWEVMFFAFRAVGD
ncbi:unnamed protein product, partial [Symbiodinium sp. KB8]